MSFTQKFTEVKYNAEMLSAVFFEHALNPEFLVVEYQSWNGKTVDSSTASKVFKTKNGTSAVWIRDYAVMSIDTNVNSGFVMVTVSGKDEAAVEKMISWARILAPEEEEPDDGMVSVTFWSLGDNGPVSRRRRIEVPSWDEIGDNYNQQVYLELSAIMDPDFRPTKAGQLLLWNGPPGTGKTTALRAMAQEWKDWCEIHFITDPEQLFGSRANYMMSVMVDVQDDKDKWRLLVLEDCGELLAKDARAQLANPQALSRFLNTVDGILGQGLRLMVLVTTNEPLGKLHEAVTRPGRCLSQIEFDELDPARVIQWAERNNIEVPPKSTSLAELFAIKENFVNKTGSKPTAKVGFGV